MTENLLDNVHINFDAGALWVLNLVLGLVMFGVALEISLKDFRPLFLKPKALILGVFSQFILLPAVTYLLILLIEPLPSIALGMFMVAACPGGNISNFLSYLSKANTALSVSLTAIATLLAIVMTPLNFHFWSVVSLLFFICLVFIALYNNLDIFIDYIVYVFWIVLFHNFIAFSTGYSIGKLFRLPEDSVRSITIETGIQNSGLGLLLIFTFFDGLGGMALIAAFWGIWHIVSGLILAALWNGNPIAKETIA